MSGESEFNTTLSVAINDEDFLHGGDGINYNNYFLHDNPFVSHDEAIKWAKNVAIEHRFFLVIASHKDQRDGRTDYVLACDRYRISKKRDLKDIFRRNTKTKANGCTFKLKVVQDRVTLLWSVVSFANHGTHNHKLMVYREGNRQVSGLSPQAKKLVADMSAAHARPNAILRAVCNQFPDLSPNRRHIYNCRDRLRREKSAGRNPAEEFVNAATNYGYLFRTKTENSIITHAFVVHKTSADLVRTYPWVICIDSTYKTNRYKYPLLELIGVTPTNKNFLIGWAFMKDERTESYEWVLEKLRDLLGSGVNPNAIITDRELSVFTPIERVFPGTAHLLCHWHITNDVEKYVRNYIKNTKMSTHFGRGTFRRLLNSRDIETYEHNLAAMTVKWGWVSGLMSYLENTWLEHKEKFIFAWTNKVRHYGNTTNCRCESQHAALKNWIATSTSSIDTLFESTHAFIEAQLIDIRNSLEMCSRVAGTEYTNELFVHLNLKASHYCLRLIKDQLIKLGKWNYDVERCTCAVVSTHGIPCACRLLVKLEEEKPIYTNEVDPFWMTLEIGTGFPTTGAADEAEQDAAHFANLVQQVSSSDPSVIRHVSRVLFQELNPNAIEYMEPTINTTVRGRPRNSSTRRDPSSWEYSLRGRGSSRGRSSSTGRGSSRGRSSSTGRGSSRGRGQSQSSCGSPRSVVDTDEFNFPFASEVPCFVNPYVVGYVNVAGDGNCGFRCVAEAFHGGEDNWDMARRAIALELQCHAEQYQKIAIVSMTDWIHRVQWGQGPCGPDHWMEVYSDLFPIANHYRCAVMFYGIQRSTNISITVLPWHSDGYELGPTRELTIVHLGSSAHYILLNLSPGFPVPPISPLWNLLRDRTVSGWDSHYKDQRALWDSFTGGTPPPQFITID